MSISNEQTGSFLKLENRHTGEILRLRRTHDAEGQTVLDIDGSLPPNSIGPPPHIHFHLREVGIVKSGSLGVRVGNKTMVIPAGGTAAFQPGVIHSWWNAGDVILEFGGRAIPAGDLDRYLQGVFAILNAGPLGKPSIFYLAHLLWRHRHTQAIVTPPRIVQRILFPAVILVGLVLGKYRGTEWPGSPASCTGAPLLETANV
ncbi:MAG: cupin domain-containing protein [Acidobacteria bacterium]|nr:MAG: cupin domain-containing protein [Acidobacteriota bacterium]